MHYLQQIIPNNTGTAEWNNSSLTNKQKHEIFRLLVDKAKDMIKDQDPGVVLQQLNECYQTVHTPAYEIHEVSFSPEDDCVAAIQKYLDMAQKSVDICVFTVTDDRLADPIRDCYQSGLNVRIITDDGKVFDRGSDIFRLSKAGIPTEVDHSKYLTRKIGFTEPLRGFLKFFAHWLKFCKIINLNNLHFNRSFI